MSDNSQSVWKRFVIEGLVIVVSILLAFGIDAFWQDRQDKSRTESHLKALQEEIGEAVVAVETSQAHRERRIKVIRELLALITQPDTRSTEKLDHQLGVLWGASRSASALATLEQMQSTGTLALIESELLRKALINYERYNSSYQHIEGRVISAWEDGMRPILASQTDVLPQIQVSGRESLDLSDFEPVFSSGASELLNNRDFQNALLIRLVRTTQAQVQGEELIAILNALNQQIDADTL